MKYSKLKFQKFHFINGGRTVDSLNENPRHGFIHRIVYRDTKRNLIVVDLKKNHFFFGFEIEMMDYMDWPLCFNFPFIQCCCDEERTPPGVQKSLHCV